MHGNTLSFAAPIAFVSQDNIEDNTMGEQKVTLGTIASKHWFTPSGSAQSRAIQGDFGINLTHRNQHDVPKLIPYPYHYLLCRLNGNLVCDIPHASLLLPLSRDQKNSHEEEQLGNIVCLKYPKAVVQSCNFDAPTYSTRPARNPHLPNSHKSTIYSSYTCSTKTR